MALNERELRAFLAVVDSGSLGRAAQVVHMTQPSISRKMQELERRIGANLFERHSRGMALTPAGEILLAYARSIVFEMDEAGNAIAELNGLRRGTLRIGAVAAAARSLVPQVLARYTEQAPDVGIHLMEAPDSELADALADRKIDLAIGTAGLEGEEIAILADCPLEDSYAIFASAATPPLPLDCNDAELALGCPWVMLPRGRTPRQTFENLVRQADLRPPKILIETNSIGAQVALVAATRTLGWLPAKIILPYLQAGIIVTYDIPQLGLQRGFKAYHRKRGTPNRTTRLFVDLLKEASAAPSPV